MPTVTNPTAVDTHSLHELHMELDETTGVPVGLEVILVRKINGVMVSEPSYSLGAIELQDWLAATPAAGLSRGDDIAQSLLTHLTDTGRIVGTMQS